MHVVQKQKNYSILQNDVIWRLLAINLFFNNIIISSNAAENISDQENIENKIQIEEDSTYPLNNNIIYHEHCDGRSAAATQTFMHIKQ